MADYVEILDSSWLVLNASLMEMNEDECRDLLKMEKRRKKRPCVLFRIHSRFNRLRAARERRELKQAMGT